MTKKLAVVTSKWIKNLFQENTASCSHCTMAAADYDANGKANDTMQRLHDAGHSF